MRSGQPRSGITKTIVNFREGPGLNSPIIVMLPAQTTVTILDKQDEWLRVSVNGQEGCVYSALVRLTELNQRRTGMTIGLPRLRRDASFGANVIVTLSPQTAVTILDEDGQWIKVSVDGQEGFVHRTLVS